MGTTIRPEISKKNRYWIDKHRYYELKYFCLQYPTWKKAHSSLDSIKNAEIRITDEFGNHVGYAKRIKES